MTLLDVYATSLDQEFIHQVESAMYAAALTVVGEDGVTATYSVAKTDKRHATGKAILSGDGRMLGVFVKAVAASIGDVVDPKTLTDLQITNAVDDVWNDVAGVKFEE